MNRVEFMKELEHLLMGISTEERRDALDYYNDYFDDAGAENEEQVIKELGSPQKVAETIKDALGNDDKTKEAYTATEDTKTVYRNNNTFLKILLIGIILFFGWPIILVIVCVVFSVFVAIASLIFGLGVTGVAVLIAGIALLVSGLVVVIACPAVAMLLCGTGILMGVGGLLFTMLVIKICQICIPPLFRGFVTLCRKPFVRKAVA